jgi:hypothetical protein
MPSRNNQRASSSNSLQQRREERRKSRGLDSVCDWGTVDAERIIALISTVTSQNGLCSFGYTRDAGAYTVTVIMDGERYTDYCRPTEDVGGFLDSLREDYQDLGAAT